jgi:hypothetical protein
MAITTLDSIVAGFQNPIFIRKTALGSEAAGCFQSFWGSNGLPTAAAAPAAGVAGEVLNRSTTGAIIFPDTTGAEKQYLSGGFVYYPVSANIYFCDRLWQNSGIAVTTTTAQTINSVAFPSRDRNGSTNGEGVYVAIEVVTATTNAGAITNTTMSYTNSDGVSGRTATIRGFPATAVAGTFVQFTLQAGDKGVRSIQSVTLGTSYGGGAITLVAYRPIADWRIRGNNTTCSFSKDRGDILSLGMPEIFNGTCGFFILMNAATSTSQLYAMLHSVKG